MTPQQRTFTLIIAFGILLLIIELVRRRRLREEYSWLWLLTGFVIVLLVLWDGLLKFIAHLTGIIAPQSIVFFFGSMFLILINIHYSVKISELSNQVKNLAQELAILRGELKEVSRTEMSATEQEIVAPKGNLLDEEDVNPEGK